MGEKHKIYTNGKIRNEQAYYQFIKIVNKYCSNELVNLLGALSEGKTMLSEFIIDEFLDELSNALVVYGLDQQDEITAEGKEIEDSIDFLVGKRHELVQLNENEAAR